MQLLPWQQPLAQLAALHPPPEQAPATQLPLAHGGELPQRQAPSLEQLSALFELQATQRFPPAPQEVNAGVLQVPEQQPLGQLAGLQAAPTQAPAAHCCPAKQAGLAPHWHWPATQLSERRSQARHTAPLAPHPVSVEGVQTAPWQQPVEQVLLSQATQAPPVQRWLPVHDGPAPQPQLPVPLQVSLVIGSQAAHSAPGAPQAVAVGVTQALLEQHPVRQVAAVHAGATQLPLTHCWPPPQAGPVPHLQLPAEQLSAVLVSHIAQMPPAVPHCATEGELQVSPAQQPVVHEVASQTQAPPTHRVPAPQAGPAPHEHWPAVHLSAVARSHAWQANPGVPQVPSD